MILQENLWQDFILSYNQEENAFFLFKNNHLLNKIPAPASIPTKTLDADLVSY